MSSIDVLVTVWTTRGWLALLAFTAAVLVVAALRRPCRRLFGTERAFQLWGLPPLAMLASQLPHAAAPAVVLPAVASAVAPMTALLPAHVVAAGAADWRVGILLLWSLGGVASLLLAVYAQARYRAQLRGATCVVDARSAWPLLHAAGTDVGPALVGAWRSRIVLPADFECRYDATEQMLILAHEAAHARRHDGSWCLLARLAAALFWFHPLAWWALAALRHDQELACDAAVLREHGSRRRSYANAMLKTQSAAFALPVGCPWSPCHPVTERIAMLKLPQPNPFRRRAGGVMLAFVAVGMAGAVYAATPPPPATTGDGRSDHYTLKIDVAMGGRPESMHFTSCLKPGQFNRLNGTDGSALSWQGRFAVSPAAGGQLQVDADVDTRFDRGDGKVHTQSAKPIVRTLPGKQASIVFGQVTEGGQQADTRRHDDTIRINLTPSIGCAAATSASASADVARTRPGHV